MNETEKLVGYVEALADHLEGLNADSNLIRRGLAGSAELRALLAHVNGLENIFDNEAAITVNVLRKWPREQIVRFAEHLIGDDIRELRAENERLKDELDVAKAQLEGDTWTNNSLRLENVRLKQDAEKLEQQNAALKEALNKYGGHRVNCGFPFSACSCEFSAYLKAALEG